MKHWHFDERGGGKTEHLINAVLQTAQEEQSPNILVLTPNDRMLRPLFGEISAAWIKMRGPEWVEEHHEDRRLELDAGESTAHVYFVPALAGAIQQITGYLIHFVAGDEYQDWEPDAYPAYEALLRRQPTRPDEYLTISEREES